MTSWSALLIPLLFTQVIAQGIFDNYIDEENKKNDGETTGKEENKDQATPKSSEYYCRVGGKWQDCFPVPCGSCLLRNQHFSVMILFKPKEEQILILIDGSPTQKEQKEFPIGSEDDPVRATFSWYKSEDKCKEAEKEPKQKKAENGPLYAIYNDAMPYSPGVSTGGSSKGVIVYRNSSGFFMTHTVPGFPDVDEYKWTEEMYSSAHLFICLTLDKKMAEDIMSQLSYAGPLIYAASVPKDERKREPGKTLYKLLTTDKQRPSSGGRSFNAKAGKQNFFFFMKVGRPETDLTGDLIAKHFAQSFAVFTGVEIMKGDKKLPSKCRGGFKVENVRDTISVAKYDHTPYQNDFSWSCSSQTFCLLSQGRTVKDQRKHGMATCVASKKARKSFCSSVTNKTLERC
ncbi:hypothetical protein M513_07110, partial [Trichuris suis]